MKLLSKSSCALAAICAAGALLPTANGADLQYHVFLNTASLMSNSSAPFYLDFQLNDGKGTGDNTNSVTLSGFDFGGGLALGTASTFGGTTGSLSTKVNLNDSTPFNEFYQGFTAGSTLSFNFDLTTNVESGPIPDLFAFAILDKNLMNIPTNSGGSDSLLVVDIDSTPSVDLYSAGPAIALAAPTVTPVPEPSTYGIMASVALLGIVAWKKRSQRA